MRGPLGFLKVQLLPNIKKIEGGPFGDYKKLLKKKRKMRILRKSHNAEKFKRGDPLGYMKLQFDANCQKF